MKPRQKHLFTTFRAVPSMVNLHRKAFTSKTV